MKLVGLRKSSWYDKLATDGSGQPVGGEVLCGASDLSRVGSLTILVRAHRTRHLKRRCRMRAVRPFCERRNPQQSNGVSVP